MSFFRWWVYGNTDLKSDKRVKFSSSYKVDTNFLTKNIERVKKSLPADFWNFRSGGQMFENQPNESAIWFTEIFANVDKSGNVKIYSAIKVTFEGTDARIDAQRRDPKIKNVEFIIEKSDIEKLQRKLKASPKARMS